MTDAHPRFAGQDHFALLGLPRGYAIDAAALENAYRDIQARVHPDKHAHLSETERRVAMQWATQVNEAYRVLRDPLQRARYLLQIEGHDPRIETNTAMPAEFLMRQMELRETVEEARAAGEADRLDTLHRQVRKEMAAEHEELRLALDDKRDFPRAGEIVRQLMFEEKLLGEIDEALEATES